MQILSYLSLSILLGVFPSPTKYPTVKSLYWLPQLSINTLLAFARIDKHLSNCCTDKSRNGYLIIEVVPIFLPLNLSKNKVKVVIPKNASVLPPPVEKYSKSTSFRFAKSNSGSSLISCLMTSGIRDTIKTI